MFSSFTSRLSSRASALASRRLARGGHGHGEPQFNEPGGYLFGQKPGVKYEKEGWETIWYGGLGISALLIFFGLRYKPDTR
ncbi:hypothetical protein EV177_002999 [Coemansia sp. RSA 1804]|nr:hypothetical protein EV177_002999 [Coemansia sp. RSA 1804]